MLVIAFGVLREDIYLSFDFSVPLMVTEKKIDFLKRAVGGSVHNTCRYLVSNNDSINVKFYTLNYSKLIKELISTQKYTDMCIVIPNEELYDYPTSVVGLKENGDKQIISYDPAINYDLLLPMFEEESLSADIIYTSLYEVVDNNIARLTKIFMNCIKNEKVVMIDLCPYVSKFSKDTVISLLKNVTVISGNNDEFQKLLVILGLREISELFEVFESVNNIFVKMGELGALLFRKTEDGKITQLFQKASPNHFNKNTTGCGDVFNACIIRGLCNNDNYSKILLVAVTESAIVAKEGLPWIETL